MLRRRSVRARVIAVPLVPAVVLVVLVALDARRSPLVLALAIGAALVGLALAVVVARTITRPLRDLAAIAAEALDDAEATRSDTILPPRELRAGGEIANLAVSVQSGRRRAAELISEQRLARRSVTDLVAHLALRNDRLLGAALDALGEISRRDHQPATAAALARVHRLVARVDRATASALVLIGEGGRLAAAPTTIADITWSAALALESADRVEMVSLPAATVHADAVHDIAHLVAELIDNAVAASEPPARVTVLGQAGVDGGYVMSVVDAGVGLASEELERANRRVRRLVPLSRVPTRHVGLDVVGRLARRHGISVRLGASAGGGIVVRVDLPAALFVAPVAPEATAITVTEPPEPTPIPVGAPADPVVDVAGAERAEQAANAGGGTVKAGGVPPLVGGAAANDELLPKRDHRKWAAALARARS